MPSPIALCSRFRRRLAVTVVLIFAAPILADDGPIRQIAKEAAPAAKLNADPAESNKKTPEQIRQEEEELFELLKLFADTVDQIDRNYVKEVSKRELIEAAVRGMTRELDPYSSYVPPEEFDTFKSGVEQEFGGIGVQVTMENGKLTIISPIFDTPAYKAGLMAGDEIIKVEGESIEGITLSEAIRRLKGPVGDEVTFTVRHPADNSERDVTLKRARIKVRTVIGARRKADDTWDYLYLPKEKIGYVRITAFARNTVEEMGEALKELQDAGVKGLIVDVRFDPGGLLSAAIDVSDLFVSDGVIVSTEGRNAPKRVWNAKAEGTYQGIPVAVLVNRYSASASEIFAACLKDHDRAIVIGERTWGKGSVQNIIELEGGRSALKLTTAGYMRPNGHNIHRFPDAKEEDEWGVRPSDGYEIKLTDEENAELMRRQRDLLIIPAKDAGSEDEKATNGDEHGKEPFVDKQLARAVEYLESQLAKTTAEGKSEVGSRK